MGRNKGRLALKIENIEIYNYYRMRLLSAALAQFEWHGLPETCDPLYFERSLVFRSTAAIYNLPENPDTWLSTGYVQKGGFNVYGYPAEIDGMGYNQGAIPVDKFVVCYDNVLKESILPKIELYAKLLYEIHNTFRSNLRQQNTPYIVKSDRRTLLTIRNFFNNLFGYDPVIEVRPEFESRNIEALDVRVDFKGKDMLECLQIVWEQAMNFLGITNGTTKKERMLDDELAMNRMGDIVSLQTRLLARTDFCNRFNKATGMDISVNLTSQTFDFLPYEEGENFYADSRTDDSRTDDSTEDNS